MWPNPQDPEDLVTFPEEILNGKLHFLCSDIRSQIHVDGWEFSTSETINKEAAEIKIKVSVYFVCVSCFAVAVMCRQWNVCDNICFFHSVLNQCFILYSLKTSENRWFWDVFRGYRSGTVAWNGIMKCMFSWKFFVSSRI